MEGSYCFDKSTLSEEQLMTVIEVPEQPKPVDTAEQNRLNECVFLIKKRVRTEYAAEVFWKRSFRILVTSQFILAGLMFLFGSGMFTMFLLLVIMGLAYFINDADLVGEAIKQGDRYSELLKSISDGTDWRSVAHSYCVLARDDSIISSVLDKVAENLMRKSMGLNSTYTASWFEQLLADFCKLG